LVELISEVAVLIETLHAFGICASYTEVRQFLTSAANHEIAKTEVSCIPYPFTSRK
jgi:coenzyme F420-reducing hydrogenase gamma subunit